MFNDLVEFSNPVFADYLAAEAHGEELRSAFAGFFERYDVLLTPVNPMTATPHGVQELVVNGHLHCPRPCVARDQCGQTST